MAPKSMRSRRRKNIYKDFQKVKLKAGKTLPKGLNVTDASFQSRKIQIREQLQKDGDSAEPRSHRQLSISTLLSQLEHYNINIRRDAILGLQQIIQSLTGSDQQVPPLLRQHLGPLVTRSAALIVDREPTVRQAALKLYQQLLTLIPDQLLGPFFNILIVHVCCAMTHIEEQIQLDSLKFVDILVERYPRLVAENSAELLPNFIGLIARRAMGQNSKASLAINPALKVHARKWRANVLGRLFAVLTVVYDNASERESETKESGDVIMLDEGVCCRISVKYQPSEFRFSSDQSCYRGNVLVHKFKLEGFITKLVPLLVQSWAECTGALVNNTDADDSLVPTMAAVVKVTGLLCRCLHGNDVLTASMRRALAEHFTNLFPFNIEERRTKKNDKSNKVSMVTLNLGIAEILCHVTGSRDAVWSRDSRRSMLAYVGQTRNLRLEGPDVDVLMRIVRRVLTSGDTEGQAQILELLCTMYRRQQLSLNHRNSLHDVMHEYVIPNHRLLSHECIEEWIHALPEYVLRSDSDNAVRRSATVEPLVRLMATLAPRCGEAVRSSLDDKLEKVVDVIVSTTLTPPDQRRFVELLYHVTSLNLAVLGSVGRMCRTTESDVTRYTINTIYSRILRDPDYCDIADYLSFLLSLCIVESTSSTEGADGSKYGDLVKIVSLKLCQFPNNRQLVPVILSFARNYRSANDQQHTPETKRDNFESFLTLITSLVKRNGIQRTFRGYYTLSDEDYSTLVEMLLAVIETVDRDQEELLVILQSEDVFTSILESIGAYEDMSNALVTLLSLVMPTELKKNARANMDTIARILHRSEESSPDLTFATRRQIEYELSLTPAS